MNPKLFLLMTAATIVILLTLSGLIITILGNFVYENKNENNPKQTVNDGNLKINNPGTQNTNLKDKNILKRF